MVADEVTRDGVEEEDTVFDLVLGIETEIHEDLRVVICHCLLLCTELRRVESVKFDLWVCLDPVQDSFRLDF